MCFTNLTSQKGLFCSNENSVFAAMAVPGLPVNYVPGILEAQVNSQEFLSVLPPLPLLVTPWHAPGSQGLLTSAACSSKLIPVPRVSWNFWAWIFKLPKTWCHVLRRNVFGRMLTLSPQKTVLVLPSCRPMKSFFLHLSFSKEPNRNIWNHCLIYTFPRGDFLLMPGRMNIFPSHFRTKSKPDKQISCKTTHSFMRHRQKFLSPTLGSL